MRKEKKKYNQKTVCKITTYLKMQGVVLKPKK